MIKFILIVVFIHGYGPRTNYATLGEYNSFKACQNASVAVGKEWAKNGGGEQAPKFVCANKGEEK